jgi:D-alanyl-D-alanine carboxypeptidase/D-alanyl-D-alanine-endopeptidase (penicillin-binding protein 4)
VVAKVSSPPIRDVVGQMLRESDNLAAELLVKELGLRFAREGSTAAGVGVLRQTLAAAGLPVEELVAVDGSGLDRGDRASCALLMAVLDSAGPGTSLASGFPVAARSGTLATRFVGNPAAGRLRAKTGSLDNVVGLAGYVAPAGGGDDLGFALLANGIPNDGVGRALQEQVGAVLARHPDAPPPAELGP